MISKRNFIKFMPLLMLPGTCLSGTRTIQEDLDVFNSTHINLLTRFKYYTATELCGKDGCNRSVDDIRKTMIGNCRDYAVLLIDELLKNKVTEISAAWCRTNGQAHAVVYHIPSTYVADNLFLEIRMASQRTDLTDYKLLWNNQTEDWKTSNKNW